MSGFPRQCGMTATRDAASVHLGRLRPGMLSPVPCTAYPASAAAAAVFGEAYITAINAGDFHTANDNLARLEDELALLQRLLAASCSEGQARPRSVEGVSKP